MRRLAATLGLLGGLIITMIGYGRAALSQEPGKSKSLDQELLDDEPSKPKPADVTTPPTKKPADAPGATTIPADHPLSPLLTQMREAQSLVGQRRSDAATQRLQQHIADELAAMIDAVQKSQKSSGQSGSTGQAKSKPKPGDAKKPSDPSAKGNGDPKPGTNSGPKPGPVRANGNDPAAVWSALRGKWGHLPDRPPVTAGQGARVRYLPQYELEIEQYFQRLLEEP